MAWQLSKSHHYSWRNNCAGSIRSARRAGTRLAIVATPSKKSAPPIKVIGSTGETWKRKPRIKRWTAKAPSKPSIVPIAAVRIACPRTSAMALPRIKCHSAISEVANFAHECYVCIISGGCCSGVDLENRRGPDMDRLSDGIAIREVAPVEFLINQRRWLSYRCVRLCKISSSHQRDT